MTERDDVLTHARLFLPQHLSAERQAALRTEIRAFPHNRSLFTDYITEPELLQGDGWRGLVAIDFRSKDSKVVSGLILSNSCDISPDNRRALVPNITFVPLVRLSRYLQRLQSVGWSLDQQRNTTEALKQQQITSLMYLNAIPDVIEESVALFGDVYSHPLDLFLAGERSRLFRLSDFGFYLFLFKLSIHFNRVSEDAEDRSEGFGRPDRDEPRPSPDELAGRIQAVGEASAPEQRDSARQGVAKWWTVRYLRAAVRRLYSALFEGG